MAENTNPSPEQMRDDLLEQLQKAGDMLETAKGQVWYVRGQLDLLARMYPHLFEQGEVKDGPNS
jgi:hypothetical protein